ncbi:hypothetical protein P7C70_g5864, partial [Phenoliferia sp. Uapishka_3]
IPRVQQSTDIFINAPPNPPASATLSRVQQTSDIFVNSPSPSGLGLGGRTPIRQRSPSPAVGSPVFKPTQNVMSRNGSPAPGGGPSTPRSSEGLEALIRNSALLDGTDATKSELVRFVKDPALYISTADGPLSRRPFWAFGLRPAPGEKMDIIIVNSTEGTYQLKRVLSTLLPSFDLAKSLSHASSRAPAPAPIKRDPTPAPEPPPPSAASMTREALEKEVEALRLKVEQHGNELSTVRPLAAEAAKLRVDVAALIKTNKSLTASKEGTAADFEYLKRQYSEASNAAVDRANEATVAEAEASRLQKILDIGLVQRDLFQKGESKKHKEHIERLKVEVRLLKGESRRTDSAIRQKAALWDTHVAKLEVEQQAKEDTEEVDGSEIPSTQASDEVFPCAWRATPSHACEAILPTREVGPLSVRL